MSDYENLLLDLRALVRDGRLTQPEWDAIGRAVGALAAQLRDGGEPEPAVEDLWDLIDPVRAIPVGDPAPADATPAPDPVRREVNDLIGLPRPDPR